MQLKDKAGAYFGSCRYQIKNEKDYDKILEISVSPQNAPDKEELVELEFEKGIPTKLNGEKLSVLDIILKLNEKVQQMIVDEMISTGHARALLSIDDLDEQYTLAMKIFDEKLSVRETEKLVKKIVERNSKEVNPEKQQEQLQHQAIYRELEERMKVKRHEYSNKRKYRLKVYNELIKTLEI